MRKLTRLAAAFIVTSLAVVPAFAADRSPAGVWQSSDGQASVKVTMCGDGTQLCAKLTALAGDARTAENLQLLNTYVVERAALADKNVWQGTVHLNGQTADGHITLVSSNTISVSGCQLGMCKTIEFRRVAGAGTSAVADAGHQIAPRNVALTVNN